MDDTCFDLLCKDLPADEARLFRKMLAEWSDGDENGFPVQLVLLTKAQWRAAALVPQAVNESRKLIELHLAEYQQQTKAMTDGFFNSNKQQAAEMNNFVEIHTQTTRQAAEQIQAQLDAAEAVAIRVQSLMENATSEWKGIKSSTTAQCERLEQVSNDLQDRFAWRVILWWATGLSVAFGFGCFFGRLWNH